MNRSIAAGLAALLVAGCGHMALNASNTSTIPLVWKPTVIVTQTGRTNPGLRVQVVDNRNDPGFIGRNTEDLPLRKVTTPDSVAAFVSEHMKQLISGSGVTDVGDSGTMILKAEIQQFFVEETHLYSGEVRLKVTLVSSNGKPVWTGLTSGTSIRFGRHYSAENYYETLSDSLVDAVHNLMQSETFRTALVGTS